MTRQHEKAIAEQEKAVALSPNWAVAIAHLGIGLVYACRPEEGIRTLQKANLTLATYAQFITKRVKQLGALLFGQEPSLRDKKSFSTLSLPI